MELDTRPLFRPLDRELARLLAGQPTAAWDTRTVAGDWTVRDVVAHLADTALRRVSAQRDGYLPGPDTPIDGPRGLVEYLNGLNAEWVTAMRRLSPPVLLAAFEWSSALLAEVVEATPLDAPALWPVAWAGETRSTMAFDLARDYTERWHHQAQVRDALGLPRPLEPRWFGPLLDAIRPAIPYGYREVFAGEGTAVEIVVSGETARRWRLQRGPQDWAIGDAMTGAPPPRTRVTLPGDVAWRLFFNALEHGAARRQAQVDGDAALAEPLFRVRSVMV
jgi:uncharacterized protein (TIGR03083 family)